MSQSQHEGGSGSSFKNAVAQILSARGSRRKGTDHSIELALFECDQESEVKEDRYQSFVSRIRVGLQEATDPVAFAERKKKL